jgi:hypothetical protein
VKFTKQILPLLGLLLLTLISCRHSFRLDLPVAPRGFRWQEIPEIKGAFLVPQGWYFKTESRGKTFAFFITKEQIRSGGMFKTGLSVNVVRNLSTPVQEYAQAFMEELGRTYPEAVWESFTPSADPFLAWSTTIDDPGKAAGYPLTMYYLIIANPRTNTLYLMWFESPSSVWSQEWLQGERILENFALDDEI